MTKIFRADGGLVGFSGNAAHARALLHWFQHKRIFAHWPKSVRRDDNADTIFISPAGEIMFYSGGGCGYYDLYADKFIAMGAGRDYALAAMHLGKSAREAVEVACALDVSCGMGIDTLEI